MLVCNCRRVFRACPDAAAKAQRVMLQISEPSFWVRVGNLDLAIGSFLVPLHYLAWYRLLSSHHPQPSRLTLIQMIGWSRSLVLPCAAAAAFRRVALNRRIIPSPLPFQFDLQSDFDPVLSVGLSVGHPSGKQFVTLVSSLTVPDNLAAT